MLTAADRVSAILEAKARAYRASCIRHPHASARACTHLYGPVRKPSPPFRGEREGPTPQAWEGEVGDGDHSESPTSPRPSPPPGAEREMPFPLAPQIDRKCAYPSTFAGVTSNIDAAPRQSHLRAQPRVGGREVLR